MITPHTGLCGNMCELSRPSFLVVGHPPQDPAYSSPMTQTHHFSCGNLPWRVLFLCLLIPFFVLFVIHKEEISSLPKGSPLSISLSINTLLWPTAQVTTPTTRAHCLLKYTWSATNPSCIRKDGSPFFPDVPRRGRKSPCTSSFSQLALSRPCNYVARRFHRLGESNCSARHSEQHWICWIECRWCGLGFGSGESYKGES